MTAKTSVMVAVAAVAVVCGAGMADDTKEKSASRPYRLPRDIEVGPGKLDLAATWRIRYDWFDNYNYKAYGTDGSDEALGSRLWLDIGYRMGEHSRAFLRLQDARFWLSEFDADDFLPACSHENPYDIREAYLDIRRIGDSPVGVKAGRQRIFYGDDRIWGTGDWSNAGKHTWDAVVAHWESGPADVDLIYGRRVIADPDEFDVDHYDFDAWGAYVTVKGLPFDCDLFYILKRDSNETTGGESGTNSLALNAAGTRLLWKPVKGAELGGTLVHQFGDWGNDEIAAWGGVLSGGYTATEKAWKPGAKLTYVYASGDSDPGDGKHETFDTLFGAAASLYGRMNLFCWKNLHNYQADLSVAPKRFGSLTLSYHYFCLAEEKDAWYYYTEKSAGRDKAGESGSELGHEVDLVYRRKIGERLSVEAAYGHFFAGEFLKNTDSDKDANWVSIMTTLSL